MGKKRRRGKALAALARSIAVMVVASISFLSSQSVAASAATTGRAAARAYALSLFDGIPLPSGATPLVTPTKPLHPVTGGVGYANLVDVVRYYNVPSSIDVEAFADSRFPKIEWQGNGSTSDGGYHTSSSFSSLSRRTNRHVAYCAVTYSALALAKSQQELRIDISVVWTAIHVVLLPTTGTVTLTGYDKISLMNSSSDPVHVVLTATQVKKLRSAIAQLRSSPGGLCMEDSTLYKISDARKVTDKASWSASADECPGQLDV